MPQSFSARADIRPTIYIMDSDPGANTFWQRAQNLNRFDSSTMTSGFLNAHGKKLCRFCHACFDGVSGTGDTIRIDHPGGVKALLRSAKHCPLCRFFKTLVAQRCGQSIFRDGHEFTVYTRKAINEQQSTDFFLNVGFQVKGRCMGSMAFCSEFSKWLATRRRKKTQSIHR